jgi:thioesterase domain-containing protein
MGGFRVIREQQKWEKFYRSSMKDKQSVQELYQALIVGEMSYIPSPYSGRVFFLQSANRPQSNRWDAAASWEDLIDDQEVFEAPGDHTSIFQEPHIGVVAKQLQLALNSADDLMCSGRMTG